VLDVPAMAAANGGMVTRSRQLSDAEIDAAFDGAWQATGLAPPPVIDVYPNRRAAARAYCREHPMTYVAIGAVAALLAPVVFVFGMSGLLVWYELFG
jgi:hypothetical protein